MESRVRHVSRSGRPELAGCHSGERSFYLAASNGAAAAPQRAQASAASSRASSSASRGARCLLAGLGGLQGPELRPGLYTYRVANILRARWSGSFSSSGRLAFESSAAVAFMDLFAALKASELRSNKLVRFASQTEHPPLS